MHTRGTRGILAIQLNCRLITLSRNWLVKEFDRDKRSTHKRNRESKIIPIAKLYLADYIRVSLLYSRSQIEFLERNEIKEFII